MNALNSTPSRSRPDAEQGSLEARILQAEQRLVLREENLRRSVRALNLRVRQGLRPWRLLIPAVGIGAALWVMLRLLRRRSPPPRVEGGVAAQTLGRLDRAGSWVPMLGMLWPMLPAPWRARIHPTVAQFLLGIGLPWLDTLLKPPGPSLAAAGDGGSVPCNHGTGRGRRHRTGR